MDSEKKRQLTEDEDLSSILANQILIHSSHKNFRKTRNNHSCDRAFKYPFLIPLIIDLKDRELEILTKPQPLLVNS